MLVLFIITSIAITISVFADLKKTLEGMKRGFMQFAKLVPTLFTIIIMISIALYFTPNEVLIKYLGTEAGILAYGSAAIIGSIVLLPGFIAYPLAGILVKSGVSYAVISIFITTLMMVGIMTLPIESKYFGHKTALLRNALSLAGSLLIGAIMAFIYHII